MMSVELLSYMVILTTIIPISMHHYNKCTCATRLHSFHNAKHSTTYVVVIIVLKYECIILASLLVTISAISGISLNTVYVIVPS